MSEFVLKCFKILQKMFSSIKSGKVCILNFVLTHTRQNQSLKIFLYDTSLETIFTYVSNTSDEPTIQGFLEWNPNNAYHLVRQLFMYVLAIIVIKLGDIQMLADINLWTFLCFQSPHIPGTRIPWLEAKNYYAW